MSENPIQEISNKLSKILSEKELNFSPRKWERLGKVVIIKVPFELERYKDILGEVYADVLKCKTTLNDTGGIDGELRTPNFEIMYGSKKTETIHIENKIKYKLDPQKVMFSSGNMSERIRMADISNQKEVVVDLFAGIGYFSLPIAVYSEPKKIYSIEKNPVSFDYLNQNISLNNVNNIIEPIQGDNRLVAPINVADRVLLGYFGNTENYLETAINCLKDNTGIIHYHDKFPEEQIPDIAVEYVKNISKKFNREATVLNYEKVKSYAPGISHYVFDIKIGEK